MTRTPRLCWRCHQTLLDSFCGAFAPQQVSWKRRASATAMLAHAADFIRAGVRGEPAPTGIHALAAATALPPGIAEVYRPLRFDTVRQWQLLCSPGRVGTEARWLAVSELPG